MSIETWKAMVELLEKVKARAIGFSNYTIGDLQEILQNSKDDRIVVPAVNQVEFHPFLYQNELLQFCNAKKYSKTAAQVLIRWGSQHDVVMIPKSIHQDRIRENSQVFDFHLEPEDMNVLDSLNENLQTVFLD